jgi:hypothetical protein
MEIRPYSEVVNAQCVKNAHTLSGSLEEVIKFIIGWIYTCRTLL